MFNENKLLIFLDFDGVTHPATGTPMFIPECMDALANALKDFDLELVVASSWRETYKFDELIEFIEPLGKNIQGITPVIGDPFLKNVRFHEVLKYLKETEQENIGWLSIDDCLGFYPEEAPVFLTNSKTGFIKKDIPFLVEMIVLQQSKQAIQSSERSDYDFSSIDGLENMYEHIVPMSRFRRELNKWMRHIEKNPFNVIIITNNKYRKGVTMSPIYWNMLRNEASKCR